MNIPLSSPDITEFEREKILEVLNTPNLSLGPKLNEFETKFSNYVGSKYSISVNSGTSGLHLCVKALDIKDENAVLTTPFSFVSTANCILFERAKPIFVDIDEDTMNIDVNKLEDKIKKIKKNDLGLKAILPVHVFGRPCEIKKIMEIARLYELKVIEDSAEALGAEYKLTASLKSAELHDNGTHIHKIESVSHNKETLQKSQDEMVWKKVGTFGDCGVFAFYPNKQITTGEGGIIVTNDEGIYELCRSMRNQGRSDKDRWLQHERLGYNYRLSDINCALGIAQLDRIEEILSKREKVAKMYNERLGKMEDLTIPCSEENKKISWFVYVVRLDKRFAREDRDLILDKLREKGIGCSNYFTPIHLQPFYRKLYGFKKGDFPVTEMISERTIALPFYNNLREEQIDYVCNSLYKIVSSF